MNVWRQWLPMPLVGICTVLVATASSPSPARAQATLPGVEYREKWSAGVWQGAAMFVDGKFAACDAHYRPAAAQEIALEFSRGRKWQGLTIHTGDIDVEAYFKGQTAHTPASLSIHGTKRDVSVARTGKTSFAFDVDDDMIGDLSRGGPLSFVVAKGEGFSTELPPETALAVANWRKCITGHAAAP